MTIVYCIPQLYNAGGMERVLTQKANYLATLPDVHVTIVTTELTPKGKPVSYFPIDKRIKVVELNIDFDADFRAPLWRKYINHQRKQRLYRQKLTDVLRDEFANICISLCGKEIDWLWKVAFPCYKMAEVHFAMTQREQLLAQYHDNPFWRLLGRMRTRQLQQAVKRLDKLVVLTHADEKAWNKAGVKNTICIPNPSSIEPNNSGEHERNEVLAVGRMHPQKGFDMLLRIWQKVVAAHPDWTLRIVGEGEERESLKVMVDALGIARSVKMNGLSKDLRSDYQRCGLFVLSSRYEGLPLALMEAMSCGCCCVAFDCPNGPAELIENGKTGMLISPDSTDSFAAEMNRLIDDKKARKQLGDAAYEHAKACFGLEPIMQQWLQLMRIEG